MDLGLQGKVAIITGSSRGLGRATAEALAQEGCHVALTARGDDSLQAVAEGIRSRGATVLAVAADVTLPEDSARLVAEVLSTFGRVDILVNNVGGSRGGPVIETTEDQFHEAMEANFFSALRLSKAVIPYMIEQGGGAIVNVASVWGREAGGPIAYNTAKAAEISMTKAMARDLAVHHIRVNSVAPGSILFPGGSWDRRRKENPELIAEFARREMPMGFGRPEDVANVIVFLVSERASHVSGACWAVDGAQGRSNI